MLSHGASSPPLQLPCKNWRYSKLLQCKMNMIRIQIIINTKVASVIKAWWFRNLAVAQLSIYSLESFNQLFVVRIHFNTTIKCICSLMEPLHQDTLCHYNTGYSRKQKSRLLLLQTTVYKWSSNKGGETIRSCIHEPDNTSIASRNRWKSFVNVLTIKYRSYASKRKRGTCSCRNAAPSR